MQRGRFCLTGGFRDMYITKNNRMFYALLIAICIQSVGVFALIQFGVVQYDAGAFPWLGTVVGGLCVWHRYRLRRRLRHRHLVSRR
ncbi:putative inner membrane protein [Kluyvera cryocrescens]|uniref:Putative inner membrane protein n=1 Tax=Kluyvera cryocrescens TaxID=580 RepID=A0A485BSQ2_KLUCR|nr:putative inner membrane protein [Kluyvera cryocrescens]